MKKLSKNRLKDLHEIFTKLEYLTNLKLYSELALFHDELLDIFDITLKDSLGDDFLSLEDYNYSGRFNF